MVFEGVPGGPMDCWGDVTTPDEHLAKSKWILETFMPWEAERCRDVELTDANGILVGRFPPTVRKPVAELPSGRLVLGLADAIMLNDPITGQGSNNAAKMAAAYLAAIDAHGDAPYDRAFMERTFEDFWDGYGQFATTWTNALLSPPPEHVLKLLERREREPRDRASVRRTGSTIRATTSTGSCSRTRPTRISPRSAPCRKRKSGPQARAALGVPVPGLQRRRDWIGGRSKVDDRAPRPPARHPDRGFVRSYRLFTRPEPNPVATGME